MKATEMQSAFGLFQHEESTYKSVHDNVEVMCDPESTKTNVTEIVWGKHVHKGKSKKKQDAGHS